VGVDSTLRASSGLTLYDAKNEALDWSQATKDALVNARPSAIIVMLGLNDRIPLRDKAPPQPVGKRAGEPAQGGQSGQGGQAGQGAQAGQPAQAAQGQRAAPAADQPAGPQHAQSNREPRAR